MAFDKPKFPVKSTHIDTVHIEGRFAPNGSSAPTAFYGNGLASIAHTATGKWTGTLKDSFKSSFNWLTARVDLHPATAAGSRVEITAIDLSAGTFVVYAWAEDAYGVAAASDLNTSDWISFDITVQPGLVHDGGGF